MVLVVCVVYVLLMVDINAIVADKTDETRLIEKILHNYNNAARPVYNASQTVTVKFGITLTQISDMVSITELLSGLCIVESH